MPNLSRNCENVLLSFNNNGLTIYSKSDTQVSYHDRFKINSSEFGNCFSEIYKKVKWEKFQEQGFGHELFHKDSFDQQAKHFHIRFTQELLNSEKFTFIVDCLLKHGHISEKDRIELIAAYNKIINESRSSLCKKLTLKDNSRDFRIIFEYIYDCKDNGLLADLHNYLLNPEFDYLRQTNVHEPYYQGENKQGEIVKTSKNWAAIEKMIALRMQGNLGSIPDAIAFKYANQFKETYPFFAIKRKVKSEELSKNYQNFENGENTFLKAYNYYAKNR